MSKLILIVDDEVDLVSTLTYSLQKEGYEVRSAYDGKAAIEQATMEPVPDLILLDLMMPELSGTEVCLHLRSEPKTKNTPIIMLTARGEEVDRVVGFEVGADDYVVKPFSVRELLLRIRALFRRSGERLQSEGETHVFGELKVDETGHRAWFDGQAIDLTSLEFRLLLTLLQRKGRVQTRDRLLADVWGYDSDVNTRTVDTHVKRLRIKLGNAGKYIETVRGVGYRFTDSLRTEES